MRDLTYKQDSLFYYPVELERNDYKLPKPSYMAKKIWLIDDDNFQNRVNKKTITKALPDVEFHIYQEALVALVQLKSNRSLTPDLIFLDMNMPGISGEDFLSQLDLYELDIPVIILSSSLTEELKNSLKRYSTVIRCLNKPLTTSKLAFLKACTV